MVTENTVLSQHLKAYSNYVGAHVGLMPISDTIFCNRCAAPIIQTGGVKMCGKCSTRRAIALTTRERKHYVIQQHSKRAKRNPMRRGK